WKYQFGVYTDKKFVTSHYHILFVAKHPKKYKFNKIEHYPEIGFEIVQKYCKFAKKRIEEIEADLFIK
ncbi:MAG: site-specific DNA-methyltransferase, partial [bacterium]|nr:site-specific DNA-methyltransferase [bacterium]MDW8163957.1 site-specific DNA-methyltransferase [Candidatus Omnitrophota bacterium]